MEGIKNPFLSEKPRSKNDRGLVRDFLGEEAAEAFTQATDVGEMSHGVDLAESDAADDLGPSAAFEKELEQEEKERIREEAKAWNIAFFGQDVFNEEIGEIPPIPEAVTLEHLRLWERLGFKLNYLPKIRMDQDRDFPGWKHKPNQGQNLFTKTQTILDHPDNRRNPHLKNLHPLELPGVWVLADTRPKPNYSEISHYDNGKQEYENDEDIRELLQELSSKGLIHTYASPGNRAKIDPKDFNRREFWQAFSKLFKLDQIPGATVRLPRVIEQNVQGQGDDWHGTRTYEWAEEYGKMYSQTDLRWVSGHRDSGGARFASWSDGPRSDTGFRPQVILPSAPKT